MADSDSMGHSTDAGRAGAQTWALPCLPLGKNREEVFTVRAGVSSASALAAAHFISVIVRDMAREITTATNTQSELELPASMEAIAMLSDLSSALLEAVGA